MSGFCLHVIFLWLAELRRVTLDAETECVITGNSFPKGFCTQSLLSISVKTNALNSVLHVISFLLFVFNPSLSNTFKIVISNDVEDHEINFTIRD